jgi:aspartyl/asparaginyl beta-hydroxylase (cupin superfamily)
MSEFLKKILLKKIKQFRKPFYHQKPNWADDFVVNSTNIQKEWNTYVLSKGYGFQFDKISKEQKELNRDKGWQVLPIFGFTKFNEKVLDDFPLLSSLIRKHKSKITLVMFSTTDSGKTIPKHHGNNHGVLRMQLGIEIFEPEKCLLKVEEKIFILKENEYLIFDDTFEHELINNSETKRTVLIIDFYKELPFIYHIINKYLIFKLGKSDYVRSVFNKL